METGHSRISCRMKDQELLALTVGKATLTRWCLDKQNQREIPDRSCSQTEKSGCEARSPNAHITPAFHTSHGLKSVCLTMAYRTWTASSSLSSCSLNSRWLCRWHNQRLWALISQTHTCTHEFMPAPSHTNQESLPWPWWPLRSRKSASRAACCNIPTEQRRQVGARRGLSSSGAQI